jgi:tetratricopeptide (TPR) repeat protein
MGLALDSLGRFEEAEQAQRESLRLREQGLGPEHPRVALSLNNLANLVYRRGEIAQARELRRRALSIRKAKLDPNDPNIVVSLISLASVAESSDETIALLHDAIERSENGPDGGKYLGVAKYTLGNELHKQERYEESLAAFEEALVLQTASFARDDHPELAFPLYGIGRARRILGDSQGAIEPLERARELQEQTKKDPALVANIEFQLAQALALRRSEQRRVLELARSALSRFEALGSTERATEVTRWLRRHTAAKR